MANAYYFVLRVNYTCSNLEVYNIMLVIDSEAKNNVFPRYALIRTH